MTKDRAEGAPARGPAEPRRDALTNDSAETIAAIATPPGRGGVGIVRISGARAEEILATLVGRGSGRGAVPGFAERRLLLATVREPTTGERLDQALVVLMRGPRTYTGEDVAEIHGHGGSVNMARLLGAVLAAGARLAEPGEFTRRAFVHGRLDLSRAEAVLGVVGAASERALRVAQAQLGGALGRRVARLRQDAVEVCAELEAAIDFPEEGLATASSADLVDRGQELTRELAALVASYRVGRALREGVEVGLAGVANVGKSSLLNALVGEERAIVADEPGTTRDWVEGRVVWDGVAVTLVDTAGERSDASGVEARGLTLSRDRLAGVDLIVRVSDATRRETWVAEGGRGEAVPELWVCNKVDVAAGSPGLLGVSAVSGVGLAALKEEVLRRVLGAMDEGMEAQVVTSERQRAVCERAHQAAARGTRALAEGAPPELAAQDFGEAARRLGEVCGEDIAEAVLDEIFSRFCIGK